MLVQQISQSTNTYKAKPPSIKQRANDLRVFSHHIYEYNKGIRNLILTTEKKCYQDHIQTRLEDVKAKKKGAFDYVIQNHVKPHLINIYFGAKVCVDVVRNFSSQQGNELTPEEDFMLGIMLGYDRREQCARYLERKSKKK